MHLPSRGEAQRSLSVTTSPLEHLHAFPIIVATSKSCDERSTDCEMTFGSCKARMLRGETIGETCLPVTPAHVAGAGSLGPGHDCSRTWENA